MEEVLKCLAEVSIRQQQIAEHLATRVGRTEEGNHGHPALRRPARSRCLTLALKPTRLLPKMTADDDVEAFLQRDSASHPSARRNSFTSGSLSPACQPVPKPPSSTESHSNWLLEGNPTAAQVAERVVVDRLLRALPRAHRQAVGMRNPTTTQELVEAIELADAVHHREAGDRVLPFPRRVVQERRPLEGTPRPVSRPTIPPPRDEPMPSAEPPPPPRAWLAGCIVHQRVPSGAPEADVTVDGKRFRALLDSGSAVTLIQSRLCDPKRSQKTFLPITCVHGDTRQVPARTVTISTPQGTWPVEAGLMKDLPVAVLLGRDWPGFDQLLTAATQPVSPRGDRRRRRRPLERRRRPVLLASDSGRDAGGRPTKALLDSSASRGRKGTSSHGPILSRISSLRRDCCTVRKSCWWCQEEKPRAVLELAHSHPMAGHLGAANTTQRIRDRFHWPGFCQACPTCQVTPLIPLPIIEVPFERIGMDIIGPLPRSARGHEHILVIVDYATRYPEAVPLRKATAKSIAQELFLLASRVGLPSEILTDQGTPFMSRLMADLCRLLRVKQLRTTVYHPQTDGLVERFNQTLKQMLRRVTAEDKRDWDLLLPYVLFGIREVPQASTGFTPFELLFGRQPRGLLDIAREAWEQQPAPHRTIIEHVRQMRERIDRVMPLVREHLSKAQQAQQRHYNRAAQPREFQPGDRVMVLVPSSACKFLAAWQGPYTVVEKVGPVTYRLRQPGRRQAEQLYHINLLKKWVGTRDQVAALSLTEPVVVDVQPQSRGCPEGGAAAPGQSVPGCTNVVHHDIKTPTGVIVRQRPYRIPEARRQAIEEEIQQMLNPIVMVPKPDGTLRFCNDFRRLNEVSEFDGYPMPRVDELLDRLGRARYISTLDLTKGYWQVPLTASAKPKTAFSTPSGHWQYRTLPFGLHGAPATFQRMMDIILRPHQAYAAAYIDDVVVHSEAWDEHLDRLRRVLSELRRAGLTANPRKCHLALSEAKYLGFQVGRGLIRPQEKKVEAIHSAPRPATKTQVRAFLGLAGYYRCFIPNFSSLAAPLTDLTRKGQPEKVCWTPSTEEAFAQIKTALTSSPVLRAPDFSCPFLLQTDASDTGLGAVLSQIQEGEEHPIIYISRKLSTAERKYAAVEKEALAIKWAVLELRYYLLGRKFTLVTDHAPLQWMARAKDTNARVTRWFLALQDFHFEVRHRAGAANANADGLSRLWTAYAGLSGVISHPPLTSPLL
ncbi:hypothetical protein M9458_043337, partial [Cirrhinus mrigala]